MDEKHEPHRARGIATALLVIAGVLTMGVTAVTIPSTSTTEATTAPPGIGDAQATTVADERTTVSIRNLSVPSLIRAGERFTVTASIVNDGDEQVARQVSYRITGNVIESTIVLIPAGATKTVMFTVTENDTRGFPTGTFLQGVFTEDARTMANLTLTSAAETTTRTTTEEGNGTTTATPTTVPTTTPQDASANDEDDGNETDAETDDSDTTEDERQDVGDREDEEGNETTDDAGDLNFEQNGVELEVDADGSVNFEDDETDLEIDSDGNIDLETAEGVELEIINGRYEIDGNGVDIEGQNDADIEVETDGGQVVEFEFADGKLGEFEVGSTELDLGDGNVELETDQTDLEITGDSVDLETKTNRRNVDVRPDSQTSLRSSAVPSSPSVRAIVTSVWTNVRRCVQQPFVSVERSLSHCLQTAVEADGLLFLTSSPR